jgi:hypothetical protein
MARSTTMNTAVRLFIAFLCFTNRLLASFKFSQISPVIHHRKVVAGTDVNFMIAVELGVVVYIIVLFHGVIFNL